MRDARFSRALQLDQILQVMVAASAMPSDQHSCTIHDANDSTADNAVSETSVVDMPQQQPRQQQQLADMPTPVLAREEVLATVFSFVGIGDHYYVAGVCKIWRDRYKSFCHKTPTKWSKVILPPHTSYSSIVVTAARLQLALDNGLTINRANTEWPCSLVAHSLEPVQVLQLARLLGMLWDQAITVYALDCRKYELCKWLCRCPLNLKAINDDVLESDDFEHMKQVSASTGPWATKTLTGIMDYGASCHKLDTVKWCREQGAAWPISFHNLSDAKWGN
jgi:hypothetical protein